MGSRTPPLSPSTPLSHTPLPALFSHTSPSLSLSLLSLCLSLNTDFARLGGTSSRTSRSSLFPAFGRLYPNGSELLSTAEDEDAMRRILAKACPEYAKLWGE